jgi:hypothetical protein
MTDRDLRDALRAVAGQSFDAGREGRIRLDASSEDDFLAGVGRERLGGLAIAATESGALTLSPEALDDLHARHEHQLALDLRLERILVDSASMLDRERIAYRALKGPVLAHGVYGDPALRSFGDVDLLVRGSSFDAAAHALGALGFGRRFAEPRPGFDARFSKGACLEREDGMELDLHRTLAPGAFGILLERVDLFARPADVFQLGSHSIAGLDRELAFVHACFHAALGDHPPRFVPLRDIVQILAAGVDDEAVIELATSVRCGAVFQRAFELVDAELHVRLEGRLPAWARAHQPSRFDRWALQSYARDDRSYAGQVTSSMWALGSMRDRFAYGAALMFPSRDYVSARERGYTRRLARAVRVMKDSRPR